jgi:dolichol-phosphate mannosyltransferase
MSNPRINRSSVTVLIPTLNEATTIGMVIEKFHQQGFDNILVMDGGSTDGTRSIANEYPVAVQTQTGTGKGAAVRQAVSRIETEYMVMVDGDGTYAPSEVDRLLAPFARDASIDGVVGNRFAGLEPGAMGVVHQFGNRVFNGLFLLLTGERTPDLLTGYRAYRTAALREIGITEEQFGVETEIGTKMALGGFSQRVVPISYRPRPEGSESELRSLADGAEILRTLARTRLRVSN